MDRDERLKIIFKNVLNFLNDIKAGKVNSKKDAKDAYFKKSLIIKRR